MSVDAQNVKCKLNCLNFWKKLPHYIPETNVKGMYITIFYGIAVQE